MLRLLFISLVLLLASTTIIWAESVNINNATLQELSDNLKGVGPKKAMAIIEYRETNGPFFAAEELINVKGIGPKTLEKNIEKIKLRD